MKKIIITIVLFVALISAFALPALADAVTYDIPEIGMTVDVPDGFLILTRDFVPDGDELERFGISEEYLEIMADDMYTSDIYLRALSETALTEYLVTMTPSKSGITDFNDMSVDEISQLFYGIKEEYASTGVDYQKATIYQGEQARYLAMTFAVQSEEAYIYGLQYYTVYEGNAVSFMVRSYGTTLTDEETSRLLGMVDSAVFYETHYTDYPEDEYYYDDYSYDDYSYDDAASDGGSFKEITPILSFAVIIFAFVFSRARSKKEREKKNAASSAQTRTAAPQTARPEPRPSQRKGPEIAYRTAGEALVQDDDDSWNYSPRYRPPLYYCENCGAKIYRGETKCGICGKKVRKKIRPFDYL